MKKINIYSRLITLSIIICVITVSYAKAALDNSNEQKIKKIIMMMNIAAKEYKEGIRDGNIINKDEYEESKVFFEQAETRYNRIKSEFSDEHIDIINDTDKKFTDISRYLKTKDSPAKVMVLIEKINNNLITITGVNIQFTPSKKPSLTNGKDIYLKNCVLCHGETGAGDGQAAAGITPKPADLTDYRITGETEPFVNYQVISVGIANTAMTGWADKLDERERWDVTYYIRTFANREGSTAAALSTAQSKGASGNNADPKKVQKIVDETKQLLNVSLEYYENGKIDNAHEAAFDSYMKYEQIEAAVINKNWKLGSGLESEFSRYRGEIKGNAQIKTVKGIYEKIETDLDKAVEALTGEGSRITLFLQSMTIILREGFEVIIIISALIAYLIKSDNRDRVSTVYKGVLAGIAASFFTAYIIEGILHISKANQEVVEAVTMLIAVAVLFYVSYWLLSKVESARWQNFIQGKVKDALTKKNSLALGMAAFLAVYREGFETVLFYKALYSYTSIHTASILSGFISGSIILGIMFYIFNKIGLRIPVKQFFMTTSIILYYMAFTFMGKGLHELQEANILGITPINFAPKIKFLGIYPSMETVAGQFILLAAFAFAVLYSFIIKPAMEKADLTRDAVHINCDLNELHNFLEHVTEHTSRCKSICGKSSHSDMRELETHIDQIDSKIHELVSHIEHVKKQVAEEL